MLPDDTQAAAVRFVLDDAVVEVRDAAPTTTLLQYLRDTLGRTGTKEGCAEGDCGACTVVVGELAGDHIAYRAVNSCIRFLPTLDGKVVVTTESLAHSDGLHPVQQAMVDCHASQCGFCTPGFVMSLFDLYLRAPAPDRGEIVQALAGNLCRCTGYRPIIDAGLHMDAYPTPAQWSRADAQHPHRRDLLASIARAQDFVLDTAPGYCAPRTLDALAQRYADHPDALLLAGGTDIGLWVTKHLRVLPAIIYLGEVAELKRMQVSDGTLEIGAAVSLADAYAALVQHYPVLADFADRFASPPIRNSGTLCGNLANGSPIGDSMPFLIALGASVTLRHGADARELPLEALYLGYQKKALVPGELVVAVRVPLPHPDVLMATYKVAKRHDQDISAICAAYAIALDGGIIASARIAYGGMAATPQRAKHAEAALIGKPWSEAGIAAAVVALAQDYQPIGDMRASSVYRSTVAGNLLRRFYLEHAPGAMPTRSGVFAPAHL